MNVLLGISIAFLALGLVLNVASLRATSAGAAAPSRRLMLMGAVICLLAAPAFLLAATS